MSQPQQQQRREVRLNCDTDLWELITYSNDVEICRTVVYPLGVREISTRQFLWSFFNAYGEDMYYYIPACEENRDIGLHMDGSPRPLPFLITSRYGVQFSPYRENIPLPFCLPQLVCPNPARVRYVCPSEQEENEDPVGDLKEIQRRKRQRESVGQAPTQVSPLGDSENTSPRAGPSRECRTPLPPPKRLNLDLKRTPEKSTPESQSPCSPITISPFKQHVLSPEATDWTKCLEENFSPQIVVEEAMPEKEHPLLDFVRTVLDDEAEDASQLRPASSSVEDEPDDADAGPSQGGPYQRRQPREPLSQRLSRLLVSEDVGLDSVLQVLRCNQQLRSVSEADVRRRRPRCTNVEWRPYNLDPESREVRVKLHLAEDMAHLAFRKYQFTNSYDPVAIIHGQEWNSKGANIAQYEHVILKSLYATKELTNTFVELLNEGGQDVSNTLIHLTTKSRNMHERQRIRPLGFPETVELQVVQDLMLKEAAEFDEIRRRLTNELSPQPWFRVLIQPELAALTYFPSANIRQLKLVQRLPRPSPQDTVTRHKFKLNDLVLHIIQSYVILHGRTEEERPNNPKFGAVPCTQSSLESYLNANFSVEERAVLKKRIALIMAYIPGFAEALFLPRDSLDGGNATLFTKVMFKLAKGRSERAPHPIDCVNDQERTRLVQHTTQTILQHCWDEMRAWLGDGKLADLETLEPHVALMLRLLYQWGIVKLEVQNQLDLRQRAASTMEAANPVTLRERDSNRVTFRRWLPTVIFQTAETPLALSVLEERANMGKTLICNEALWECCVFLMSANVRTVMETLPTDSNACFVFVVAREDYIQVDVRKQDWTSLTVRVAVEKSENPNTPTSPLGRERFGTKDEITKTKFRIISALGGLHARFQGNLFIINSIELSRPKRLFMAALANVQQLRGCKLHNDSIPQRLIRPLMNANPMVTKYPDALNREIEVLKLAWKNRATYLSLFYLRDNAERESLASLQFNSLEHLIGRSDFESRFCHTVKTAIGFGEKISLQGLLDSEWETWKAGLLLGRDTIATKLLQSMTQAVRMLLPQDSERFKRQPKPTILKALSLLDEEIGTCMQYFEVDFANVEWGLFPVDRGFLDYAAYTRIIEAIPNIVGNFQTKVNLANSHVLTLMNGARNQELPEYLTNIDANMYVRLTGRDFRVEGVKVIHNWKIMSRNACSANYLHSYIMKFATDHLDQAEADIEAFSTILDITVPTFQGPPLLQKIYRNAIQKGLVLFTSLSREIGPKGRHSIKPWFAKDFNTIFLHQGQEFEDVDDYFIRNSFMWQTYESMKNCLKDKRRSMRITFGKANVLTISRTHSFRMMVTEKTKGITNDFNWLYDAKHTVDVQERVNKLSQNFYTFLYVNDYLRQSESKQFVLLATTPCTGAYSSHVESADEHAGITITN